MSLIQVIIYYKATKLTRAKCKAAINLNANFNGCERSYHILVDTGAEINCISYALVEELKLKLIAHTIEVQPFAGGVRIYQRITLI